MLIGALVGILIISVLSSIVIWIVGKLGLGIEVAGFRSAFLAAIVIAILSAVTNMLLGPVTTGYVGSIVHLVFAALIIIVAGSFIKGFRAKGFGGAIIAAICISALQYGEMLLLGSAVPAA